MMRVQRTALSWALGVVLVLTLLTGPFVGILSVPSPAEFVSEGFGEGSADVTDVRVTDDVRLEAGAFGTEAYHLSVPSVRLDVRNVTNRPTLVYRLDVDGLGYGTRTVAMLDTDTAGPMTLSMDDPTFEPSEITASRYDATVEVLLRGDGPDRTVYRDQVAVEVVE